MVRYRVKRGRADARAGFTLVEILVALMVMGVAMTLIIYFLSASLKLNSENRSARVAAAYAQEQLTYLVSNPGAYTWSLAPDAKLTEIKPKQESESHLAPPAALPPAASSSRTHESNFYDGFSWKAFSKLPSADSRYVEVVVQVSWNVKSRDKETGNVIGADRTFTLTSSVLRSSVEGKA